MWAICACLIEFSIESVSDVFMDVINGYPDLTVQLTLFNAIIAEGELYKMEHNENQWIMPNNIRTMSSARQMKEFWRGCAR